MWTPQPEPAAQLREVLKGTLLGNNETRARAQDALAQAKTQPEYENYLCAVLLSPGPLDVRAAAGIALKNCIVKARKDRPYVRLVILDGLADGDRVVRNITGTVVAAMYAAAAWPEALARLLAAARGDGDAAVAAMAALAKISEDCCALLEELPAQLLAAALRRTRALAVHGLTQFAAIALPLLLAVFGDYMLFLAQLALDGDEATRKNVCTAFAAVVALYGDHVQPYVGGMVDFAIHCLDGDDDTAMEACEFLLLLAEGGTRAAFEQKLPRLVPVLLAHMVYLDEQQVLVELVDAPAHAQSAQDRLDEAALEEWNLRRCCAATLDALTLLVPATVDVALPLLEGQIASPEWAQREAALLALGAMAGEHAQPRFVPFLVDRLADSAPRVRQMACWTLLRHARCAAPDTALFQRAFSLVAQCALDDTAAVQEAACLALSGFVEAAPALVSGHAADLLALFGRCFAAYLPRNLVVLYDTVATFVEKMGAAVAPHLRALLEPLMANWNALADSDPSLWPLLECMAAVAAAMGADFAPYAPPVFERAHRILAEAVEMNHLVHTDPRVEAPEKDFIVTLLDLIDGLVQGLGAAAAPWAAQTVPLLLSCFEDVDDDVRQLAWALLGDMAPHADLAAHIATIVPCVCHELATASFVNFPVTNNAVWALGELAAAGHALGSHAESAVGLLVQTLHALDQQPAVLENAALCLGRIALGDPAVVAQRLPECAHQWCAQMAYLEENDEKELAFYGMVQAVQRSADAFGVASPQGRRNAALFFLCIAAYAQPLPRLAAAFADLLRSYKTSPEWAAVAQMVEGAEGLARFG